MMHEEEYLQPPACKKCEGVMCNEKGWYGKRITTGEDAQEYMTEIGLEVRKQCSWKKGFISRKKHWIANPYFETPLKLMDFTDYGPAKKMTQKQQEENCEALHILADVISGADPFDGFLVIEGKTNTGKSIFAHIIARRFNELGKYPKLVSVIDLAIETSELQRGSKIYNDKKEVIYDIDEWCKADLLVIDHFEMVNQFFKFPDIRRANLNKIFKTRLHEGLPTIILSALSIKEVFSVDVLATGIPNDLPRFINKNNKRVVLHGRFQKPPKNPKAQKEKGSGEITSFNIKIGRNGIIE